MLMLGGNAMGQVNNQQRKRTFYTSRPILVACGAENKNTYRMFLEHSTYVLYANSFLSEI